MKSPTGRHEGFSIARMPYIKTEKICKGYAITQPQATKVTEKKNRNPLGLQL